MYCFLSILIFTVLSTGLTYNLPADCKDDSVCPTIFGDKPDTKMRQCYHNETLYKCCATCKSLQGHNGNNDFRCPWGDQGEGYMTNEHRKTCNDVSKEDCADSCLPGSIFHQNCCHSCNLMCS